MLLGLTLLLATIGSLPAVAQEEIDETRPVEADARILVSNVSGSVRVIGWERNEVHLTGFLGEDVRRLDIDGDEQRLEITVVLPRHVRHVEETDLELRVPRGAEIHVETVSADVEIEEIQGVILVETVSGEIDVSGKPAAIEVQTVSGEIRLPVECDRVRVQTVSGDIELPRVGGEVEVEAVSGDIDIAGSRFERLRVNTVSGDCTFEGELVAEGTYEIEVHSGDIHLILTGEIDAEFEFSTYSGDIDSEIGPRPQRTSRYTSEMELYFSVGEGTARVRAQTFSGDIELETR